MADSTTRATEAPPRPARTGGDLSPAWPPAESTPRSQPAAPGTAKPEATTELTGTAAARPMATEPGRVPANATATAPGAAEDRMRVYAGTSPTRRMAQMVWLIWLVAELIVALRVIFKAVAANPDAGFVSFVNTISGPLITPFRSIMGDRAIGTHGGLLETSSLMAMVIFFAGALILASFLRIIAAPRVRAMA